MKNTTAMSMEVHKMPGMMTWMTGNFLKTQETGTTKEDIMEMRVIHGEVQIGEEVATMMRM
jgi:hypothetical protein